MRATHDFLSEADIRELRSLLPVRYLPAVELRCLRDAGAYRGVHRSERKSYRHVVRSARIPGQRLRTQSWWSGPSPARELIRSMSMNRIRRRWVLPAYGVCGCRA